MPLKPGPSLTRSKPLKTKGEVKRAQGFQAKSPSAIDQRKAQQKALQTATLRALDKAKKAAEAEGVRLSGWENDFIDSVSERVKTYGRAFADPDKGAPGTTLSARQGVKLKEIRQKAIKKAMKGDKTREG